MNNCNLTCVTIVVLLMLLGGLGLHNEIQELRADLEVETEKLLVLSAIGDVESRCEAQNLHYGNLEFLYVEKGCQATAEVVREILGDEKYIALGFAELEAEDRRKYPHIYEEAKQ